VSSGLVTQILATATADRVRQPVVAQFRYRQIPDARVYLGRVAQPARDRPLAVLCSAADAMVIPSRQVNLPNTGLEAHACGTPVVAFDTGGLPDIVANHITGALAEPFEPAYLAAAIRWVVEDPHRRQQLGAASRSRAVQLWSPVRVAGLYAEVYQQALDAMPL